MLTLFEANSIIEKAFASASNGAVPPLAVVVLDAAGNVISAQRQDGASMFRIDVALGKAWGAVAMGVSSRTLAARASENLNFYAGLAETAKGRLLAQPGAIIVRDPHGDVVGAVGASGGTGDQDEACCAQAIKQAGFVADT